MTHLTTTTATARPRSLGHVVRSLAVVGAVVLGAAACGDDDGGQSEQERYCDAGDSLRSSIDALLNLDVVAEGTNGVEQAFEAVEDDASELGSTATDAAADDVDALEAALNDLGDALNAAGDELTTESATAVLDAISAVGTAASAVYDTLTDC